LLTPRVLLSASCLSRRATEICANFAADPDMLIIGANALGREGMRAQMALWTVLAAPLLMGNDLRDLSADAKEILQNREVLAIADDPLGKQGLRVSNRTGLSIWRRELANGDLAVLLLNSLPEHANAHDNQQSTAYTLINTNGPHLKMSVTWEQLGLPAHSKNLTVRDLFTHRDYATLSTPTPPSPITTVTSNISYLWADAPSEPKEEERWSIAAATVGVAGLIRHTATNRCIVGENTSNFPALSVAPCDSGVAAQQWILEQNGTLHLASARPEPGRMCMALWAGRGPAVTVRAVTPGPTYLCHCVPCLLATS
jgi:hypothetical protein